MKNVGKSTYGERVGFSASSNADSGQLRVSFVKNGNSVRCRLSSFHLAVWLFSSACTKSIVTPKMVYPRMVTRLSTTGLM